MTPLEKFKIISRKHDGSFHRSWEENFILFNDGDKLISFNDCTIVKEKDKDPWMTKKRAISCFHKKWWFNVIIIFNTSEDYYFYCNLISPYVWKGEELQYVDYDIDVIVYEDLTFKVVDLDEYENHKEKYAYPKYVQRKVLQALTQLKQLINNRYEPFTKEFVKHWYGKLTSYDQ